MGIPFYEVTSCGKGVAGEVKRMFLVDAAHSGEFFQITAGGFDMTGSTCPLVHCSVLLLDYRER